MMADMGRLSWQCLAGIHRLAATHSCRNVIESWNIVAYFSGLMTERRYVLLKKDNHFV